MKKTGIFFGSSTGYTADAANRIGRALGIDMADIHDVANTAPSRVGDYDVILLGCSTWATATYRTISPIFSTASKPWTSPARQ